MDKLAADIAESGNLLSEKRQEALDLHYDIKHHGENAVAEMVALARGLKQMHDSKLYLELGCESFESYVEQKVGLKQRQAYTYIKALETFGDAGLQSNAKIGISKLGMLASLPWHERDEVLENNDVEAMTTRQLKETIAKLHETEEQLTFAKAEIEEVKETAEDIAEENKKLEKENETLNAQKELYDMGQGTVESLREELKTANKKLEEERAKPQKVVTQTIGPSESDLKRIKSEAEEEASKKYNEELARANAERDDALRKAEDAAKASAQTVNQMAEASVVRFKVYFDAAQENIKQMHDIISEASEEVAEKLEKALNALKASF